MDRIILILIFLTIFLALVPGKAMAQDVINVVWQDASHCGEDRMNILHRSSVINVDFQQLVGELSTTFVGESLRPDIAVSPLGTTNNSIHVVWYDTTPVGVLGSEASEIGYRRSTDGGASFGSLFDVSNSPGGSYYPAIAATLDKVYVVWYDKTIGNSWGGGGDVWYEWDNLSDNITPFDGASTALSSHPETGRSLVPDIAASGNNVYVVWEEDTEPIPGVPDAILLRRSTDGGLHFGPVISLGNNIGIPFSPKIAASGNNVYVVWEEIISGADDILYRRSTDGGATFGDTINLSNNAGNSNGAAIAVQGDNVYVVWSDDTESEVDRNIFYKRSMDGGASFSGSVNLSNNDGRSHFADVTTTSNGVYVVWADERPPGDFFPEYFDIFYRRSTDDGASFSSIVNLNNNPFRCSVTKASNPGIAAFTPP